MSGLAHTFDKARKTIGNPVWYHDGALLPCAAFNSHADTPAVTSVGNDQAWYDRGMPHRGDDKPAYIGHDGEKIWYWNGKRERENDQPAHITAQGDQIWYKQDRKHRVTGPAVVYADKSKPDEYWIHGTQRTPENHAEYLMAHAKHYATVAKEEVRAGSTRDFNALRPIKIKPK
ncbi:MAG TPA: hypothetical protein VHP34_00590 [Alphaproteobacteria bacterium]|nr:hypothetical protein [Alphaproteobacteria bacterium]